MRMRKKKHGAERIAACAELLIEDTSLLATLGEEGNSVFPETRPLHMEIGCGKGNFAVGMAAAHPEWNFIAMERVADVACCALEKAKACAEERPGDNLRVLIGNAEHLGEWVKPHSVSRIYLNFSDPWPKKRYAKRRLTYRSFLALYDKFLTKDGMICFKTDNRGLFEFSICELSQYGFGLHDVTFDLHATDFDNVMTEYEKAFTDKGQNIYRLVAKRRTEIVPEPVETVEDQEQ